MRVAAAGGRARGRGPLRRARLLLTKYRSGARPDRCGLSRAAHVVRAAGSSSAARRQEMHRIADASRGNISTRCRPASARSARVSRTRTRGRRAARLRATTIRVSAERALPQRSSSGHADDGDLVLVDFEYAVRAAPALDLAGLAGMNDYGENECRELLAAYYAGGPPRVSLTELGDRPDGARVSWAAARRAAVAAAEPYAVLAAALDERLSWVSRTTYRYRNEWRTSLWSGRMDPMAGG